MGDYTINVPSLRKEEIFNKVQSQMVDWQKHNFPNRPGWIPLMGMVEEIGELAEADYKDGGKEEVIDAIGDTTIYLADYCNEREFSLISLYMSTKSSDGWCQSNLTGLTIEIGRLAHAHIKQEQNIRLNDIAEERGTTLADCLKDTWEVVKKRDWQKNRNNADKV